MNNNYDLAFDLIDIEDESYERERAAKSEFKQRMVKNIKLRKAIIRKKLATIALTGGALTLIGIGGAKLFEEKPVNVVATELYADAGLHLSDNGKKFSGEMTEQEIINYINENEVSMEDVKDRLNTMMKWDCYDTDFGMEKVENANPEVFEDNGKGMGM